MRAILLATLAALPLAGSALGQENGRVFFCDVVSPTAVYDVDSWTCRDKTKVRAWGVNGRERNEPGGREARDVTRQLIGGRMLACQQQGKSWGRVVARCVLPNGVDIAEELVRAGAAWDCARYSKGAYAGVEAAVPSEPTDAHRRMCE